MHEYYLQKVNSHIHLQLNIHPSIYIYNNYLNSEALIKNKLNKNKKFYNKNPYITTINGEKVGIYIDDKEHVVSNVCPHMKCNLIFDNFNKTWVCPCHGSEYTLDGEIINGPSCYDIRKD